MTLQELRRTRPHVCGRGRAGQNQQPPLRVCPHGRPESVSCAARGRPEKVVAGGREGRVLRQTTVVNVSFHIRAIFKMSFGKSLILPAALSESFFFF